MTVFCEHNLSVPASNLSALGGGRGPLVLCLHGFAVTADMWRPTLPALIAAGYSALAIDLPGHGGSFQPAHPLTIADLARVVDDVLAVLGVEKAFIIGNSLGGAVASEFALTHPERVLRLVLEDAYALDASLALSFLRDGEFRTRIVGPALLEALTGRPPSSTPARARLVFHDPNRVPADVFVVRYPGGWVRNYWAAHWSGWESCRTCFLPRAAAPSSSVASGSACPRSSSGARTTASSLWRTRTPGARSSPARACTSSSSVVTRRTWNTRRNSTGWWWGSCVSQSPSPGRTRLPRQLGAAGG